MLNFKKPDINDLKIIKNMYGCYKDFSCENTTVNILIWQNHFSFEFCVLEDTLFTKVKYGDNYVFAIPASHNMKNAVTVLKEYCNEKSIPLIFIAAEGERLDAFRAAFEEKYSFTEVRDSFEYIYSFKDLSELSGKKYHGKRNHISSFKKKYDWSYETLNKENLTEAYEMTEEWYRINSEKKDRFMEIEENGVKAILKNFGDIDVKGGLLRVDGKVIAVTFGSEINSDVFDVSYEKAFKEYDGAYTVINNCFVSNELQSYSLVNREDDMGIEGLRKAKLSYNPQILLKKYLIKEKQ